MKIATRSRPAPTGPALRPHALAALVAAAFLALHLPYLPASLEDLDSINFALGLRHFDVAAHQPHPPGYPLYIAAAKGVQRFIPSEAKALALVGIASGALGVMALVALFTAIDGRGSREVTRAIGAALLTVTAPLYWVTAARPLSDVAGLVAALAAAAMLLSAASGAALVAASFFSGFAAGIRSQVAWLTVSLLILVLARRSSIDNRRAAGQAGPDVRPGRRSTLRLVAGAYVAGVLAWGVPIVIMSGGPTAYWHTLVNQGAEDLSGIVMLWTTPTPRQLARALFSAFVAPWGAPVVATVVLALAVVGAVRRSRVARPSLAVLAVVFGPYLVFDLLFQETATIRYALPLVVPVAYLAVDGAAALGPVVGVATIGSLAMFDAHVGGTSLAAYASREAPAFRLLEDMRHASSSTPSPVVAMHRREDLDMRRPLAWTSGIGFASRRLAAPPKHEWRELVRYWNEGGRSEVWFVADPLRSDLALVDHAPASGMYRWGLPYPVLIGGVRPSEMDWYRITVPGWYVDEGWALTPEAAGVAREDGRGPGRGPIQGRVRRRPERTTVLVGGRHLASGGAPARVSIALDGRTIDEPVVGPGFFLRMAHLGPGVLEGDGDYATITVSARSADDNGTAASQPDRLPPAIAIEQFNVQSDNRVIFGFGEGWHEQEYNPSTGALWRWTSERAALRVHAAGRSLMLTIGGEPPSVYFSEPSHVRVTAGGRVLRELALTSEFFFRVPIPAELVDGDENVITIETDQVFVPGERTRRSPDRRHLGLRVFACDLSPAS